jgi:HPt (histidine-containing phosphotransfer) domain-containing protein
MRRTTLNDGVTTRQPTAAPSASTALDEEILAETAAVFGRDRANELLGQLGAQLAGQFVRRPTNAEERAQLAREAHKLISTGDLFGFAELAASCLELEVAIKRDAYSDEFLDRVRAVARAAAITIASRLAEAPPAGDNGCRPSAAIGAG